MSRKLFVLSLLLAVACTDQTEVTDPDSAKDVAPVPTSEAELDFSARNFNRAHTALSGGATTVFDVTADAFSLPAPNLTKKHLDVHELGDVQFEVEFEPDNGLGPVFDNVSCEGCHGGDGRGRPPARGEQFASFLFRGSVPGFGPHGGPNPIPGFGTQIQLRAIDAPIVEASASIAYTDSSGTFADGSPFTLRVPHYTLIGGYTALPAGFMFSPRSAPAVFGLGLLEAVSASDVLAMADPRDRNRDGVSGRANVVWDAIKQQMELGRFGWKANTPNLVQQAAGAYNGDMGITSSIFPAESCEGQYPECAAHAVEIDPRLVQAVAFYTQTLGVPARRDLDDPTAKQGERLFYAAGCNGCHVPTLRTAVLRGVPEVSNQVIHPYTDLLLHDMGPALADGRPDFRASAREWRTAPLWGIGLLETVNHHTNLLHDGRARGLLEAVLWHGGEATNARERVRHMPARDRDALIAFLQSL